MRVVRQPNSESDCWNVLSAKLIRGLEPGGGVTRWGVFEREYRVLRKGVVSI